MTHNNNQIREQDNILFIDNIALKDIAKTYKTPCYIYSADIIRSQFTALKEALGRALQKDTLPPLLCYACKANSNIAILKILQTMGSGLEIVSKGELLRGLKAGIKGSQMISTSFGKNPEEIKACLDADLLQFNIESIDELKIINDIAKSMGKTAQVAFRLNPDIAGGGHTKISTGRKEDKFGNTEKDIAQLYHIATNEMENLTPVGLSLHIGSQISRADIFKPGFEKLAQITTELRGQGFNITTLDIGGGFPIRYNDESLLDLDEYANLVRDIIAPLDVQIQMEPGRYMVGNAGVLLSQVQYIKHTPTRDFMVLDAGMHSLLRPAMYGAYHEIRPIEKINAPLRTYDIVGPICESSDIFAKGRSCPEVTNGDIVAIMSAGAYGYAMASNYNSQPLPAEILIDGDNVALINAQQSWEDLSARETIPKWL